MQKFERQIMLLIHWTLFAALDRESIALECCNICIILRFLSLSHSLPITHSQRPKKTFLIQTILDCKYPDCVNHFCTYAHSLLSSCFIHAMCFVMQLCSLWIKLNFKSSVNALVLIQILAYFTYNFQWFSTFST